MPGFELAWVSLENMAHGYFVGMLCLMGLKIKHFYELIQHFRYNDTKYYIIIFLNKSS